jgi:Trm5-related predicted tRNA methylase
MPLVIDYGLWDYHTPVEKRLLMRQSLLAWHELRRCLGDALVLASCPAPVRERFGSEGFTGQILAGRYRGDAVLLDPRADETLAGFDKDITYIIGGMVDRSNRMRTSSLGYDCPRAALRLDGRSSNVSDRLNHIARAFCLNIKGTPLEKALRRA